MLDDARCEREREVLSTLILRDYAYRELPEDFKADHFEDPVHREIYEVLQLVFLKLSAPVRINAIPDDRIRMIIHTRILNPPVSLDGLLEAAASSLRWHDHLEPLPDRIMNSPEDPAHFQPLTGADIQRVLNLTIKYDHDNKLICFLAMLSAYSAESQMNLLFNAPSSTGKSYIPMEVAKLFPQEDIFRFGGASPTAFFHSGKFDKQREVYIVDLERKILIFLDQPHAKLLERLRSLLSHDDKVIIHKITDKTDKGGTRTKEIHLRGFPAVVFCSATLKMDEQEATRCFLLSPETNQEKIRAGVEQKIRKEADPEIYSLELDSDPGRRVLKARIRAIRQAHITEICIPSYEKELLERNFLKPGILKPRAQRDVDRVISLCKAFALLNLWFRQVDGSRITVNEEDVNEAIGLWDRIADSQELGLPPYLFQFYREILLKTFTETNAGPLSQENPTGLSRKQIMQAHLRIYGRSLSMDKLRLEILPQLEASGLILQEQDPENRRNKLVFPTSPTTLSHQGSSPAQGEPIRPSWALSMPA